MKSENEKKWSEEDVDEILTSFFKSEIPSRLAGPVPVAIQKSTPLPSPVIEATNQSRQSTWVLTAMVACAAALMFAVVTSMPSSNDAPAGPSGNALVSPAEEDERPINVNDTDNDSGDIAVPEQDIEILD
jgi:hypothetical protein